MRQCKVIKSEEARKKTTIIIMMMMFNCVKKLLYNNLKPLESGKEKEKSFETLFNVTVILA